MSVFSCHPETNLKSQNSIVPKSKTTRQLLESITTQSTINIKYTLLPEIKLGNQLLVVELQIRKIHHHIFLLDFNLTCSPEELMHNFRTFSPITIHKMVCFRDITIYNT